MNYRICHAIKETVVYPTTDFALIISSMYGYNEY